jgi:uncharacterized protein YoxC
MTAIMHIAAAVSALGLAVLGLFLYQILRRPRVIGPYGKVIRKG